jgi:O-methyltransferase involved in polyketide biosynthesis
MHGRTAKQKERKPSGTALGAAVHRAAHQDLEGGQIIEDPFASPLQLGPSTSHCAVSCETESLLSDAELGEDLT